MRYRELLPPCPTIRVRILGREVLYLWIPLRISVGSSMGLWISWGHRAQLQVSLFGSWWKPMMWLGRRFWRWECLFWTITRFR